MKNREHGPGWTFGIDLLAAWAEVEAVPGPDSEGAAFLLRALALAREYALHDGSADDFTAVISDRPERVRAAFEDLYPGRQYEGLRHAREVLAHAANVMIRDLLYETVVASGGGDYDLIDGMYWVEGNRGPLPGPDAEWSERFEAACDRLDWDPDASPWINLGAKFVPCAYRGEHMHLRDCTACWGDVVRGDVALRDVLRADSPDLGSRP